MKKTIETNNATKGMDLQNGKRHYDSDGNPLGGIKAKVINSDNQQIEVEMGEVIITRDAVSNPKKYKIEGTTKEILSTLNQEGGGVPINDSEAEILAKYREGGKIPREKQIYLGKEGGSNVSPKGMFESAVKMEKDGIDSETIRSITGWFRSDLDGLWRYEISDKEMEIICTFTDKEINHLKTKNNYIQRHLKDVIKHDELFKAYPRIKYLKVLFIDSNNSDVALLDVSNEGVMFIICNLKYEREISDNRRSGEERKTKRYNTLHFRKVITHELQHAIQINEGLAEGGNPNIELKKIKANSGAIQSLTEKEQEYIATQRYLNKAGEIEAMSSDVRIDYNDLQRMRNKPYSEIAIDLKYFSSDLEKKIKFKIGGDIPREKHLYLGEEGGLGVSSKSVFDLAIQMEKDGIDSETIRIKTGWFRNPFDKLWRYEISDENMDIIFDFNSEKLVKLESFNDPLMAYKLPLKQVIIHNELFKAYPSIKDLEICFIFDKNSNVASLIVDSYNNVTININLYGNRFRVYPTLSEINGRTGFKAIITHELQHVIQVREGLSSGSSVKQEYKKLLSTLPNDESTKMEVGSNREDFLWGLARRNYLNSLGEIESRDSQKRVYFDKKTRIEIPPYSLINFKNEEVVVVPEKRIKFRDGGDISKMTPSELKEFYDSPEGRKLDAETYSKWKELVNMTKSELKEFYNSPEGKEAGLTQRQANEQGIDSGRESARWIMKMKDVPYREWTSKMWKWAKKQINFIKRMNGIKGDLYDENGNKTRKHTALLIWGHNPEKKFKNGGDVKGYDNFKNPILINGFISNKKIDGKEIFLITYNSGGQEGLNVHQTMNPLPMLYAVEKKTGLHTNTLQVFIYEHTENSNRIEDEDELEFLKDNHTVIIVDRDSVEFYNGDNPEQKLKDGGYVPKDVFAKSKNERNEDYEANWNLWIETLLKNEDLPIHWTTSESRKEIYGDSFYIMIFNEDWQEFAKLRFSGHSVMNTSRLQNEFHNPNISRFYEIVSRAMSLNQQEKHPENSIKFRKGGELIKRADGSYSERGLWDNIRANIGSGRKPTKQMLEQEMKIREKYHLGGNPDILFRGEGEISEQGTLYTKDKKTKLEYIKNGSYYEFSVFEADENPVDGYSRNQYKKHDKNKATMNYNQFVKYLHSESYLHDKFRGGGEISQQALNVETNDLTDFVRKYFIRDGRIDVADAMQELFGDKRGKSIADEYRKRIGLHKKGGYTISQLAHKLWEEHKDEVREGVDDTDFRNAVEEVLLSEYGVKSMIESLLEKQKEMQDDESNYWMDQYGEEDYYDDLTDEEVGDYFKDMESFEKEQLAKGKEHEMEHLETLKKVAEREITPEQAVVETAKTHIEENPEYYDDLAKMEAENEESIPKLIEGLQVLMESLEGADREEIKNTIEGLKLLL